MKHRKKAALILWICSSFVCVLSQDTGKSGQIDWSRPVLLSRPDEFEIPSRLKNNQSPGTAVFKAQIDPHGNVVSVTPIRSDAAGNVTDILANWITKWEYAPRLEGHITTESFTVITIRYERDFRTIEAPHPLDLIVEIPEPIVIAITSETTRPSDGNVNARLILENPDISDNPIVLTIQ